MNYPVEAAFFGGSAVAYLVLIRASTLGPIWLDALAAMAHANACTAAHFGRVALAADELLHGKEGKS